MGAGDGWPILGCFDEVGLTLLCHLLKRYPLLLSLHQ